MQPTVNKELEAKRAEIEKQVAEFKAGGGKIQKIPIGVLADGAPKPNKGGKKAKELTRQEAHRLYKIYQDKTRNLKMQDVAEMAGMGRTCLKKNWLKWGLLYNHSDRNNKNG